MTTLPASIAIKPGRGAWRWYTFGLFCLLTLACHLDMRMMSVLVTPVKEGLHLTDQQVARPNLAFTLSYIFVPLLGFLGDWYRRKPIILAGLLLWSVTSAGSGLSTGLASLLLWRVFVGLGEGVYNSLSPSWLADIFPPRQRGIILAIFSGIGPFGSSIAYVIGSAIAQHHGWRVAFFVSGIPGLLLALLLLLEREPARGASEGALRIAALPKPRFSEVGVLLREPDFLIYLAATTLFTFGISGVSFWGTTYFHRQFGVTNQVAASYWGYGYLIFGFLGALLGGFGGTFLRRLGTGGYSTLGVILGTLCVLTAIPALRSQTLDAAEFWFSLNIVTATAISGLRLQLLLEMVPATIRGTAVAIQVSATLLLSTLINTELMGSLSDRYGLAAAFWLIPFAFLLSVPLFAQLSFRLFRKHRHARADSLHVVDSALT